MTDGGVSAEFAPGRPVPLRAILGALRRGAGDPTWRQDPASLWRASRTPDGPVTMRLTRRTDVEGERSRPGSADTTGDRVEATAWGPGGDWALAGLGQLLGEADDPTGFAIQHATLRDPARRHQHWRVGRTRLVIEALVPAIIEQRVTGKQAFGAYRTLVRTYGEPAPGPGAALGLLVPPSVQQWRRVPSWQWLRAGVDAQRSDTIQRALSVAPRLAEIVDLPRETAWQRLRSIPGIGVWTAAETMQRALGDADAVSFGDYHVATDIGHALTGAAVDDLQLEELLRPYAGHRYRVQYLVTASRLGPARRGARITIPTHLPR
ncbi:DNA-3-methyladenine glycosylase family protein [Rudaeicoccus suwonensis]|uniref:3-methyladenine DNA glycosylase/8-oxoguanine DNA glycosylase n=1 Tax=Rudaeicoccus suwonensis TaxID=657409 RepID=A0A561E973_9MICO|nr:DNA-3-methyladenine glycosylase 2 family protein [Rudaeicoccus suwonensis]TWE12127.1 3-methyladenine DNA glycosylase/8-oxoguanine DNA glycosylase [Rudaeicoccus suwonensis]